jgi:dihydrofolate synthase/folylpolyglutamate synthase
MLADKDIEEVVKCFLGSVDQWYLASLDVARGATAHQLEVWLPGQEIQLFEDPTAAYQAAYRDSEEQDRIVVFGSFYTVAAALSQAV